MEDKLSKIFWLVLLLIIGAAGVMFILPNFWLRLLFTLLFLAILAWTVNSGRRVETNMLGLITAYFLSAAQFGLQFFFQWPGWVILITTFLWVTLLFWLNFRLKIGNITGSAKVLSIITGLTGAQIALALVFWPTHFLVSGTVFFLFFYLTWMMSNFYMMGILNRHRMIIHGIFSIIVLALVLFTAQWTI